MTVYCPTITGLKQEFEQEVLREIQVRAGPVARQHAKIAFHRPDMMDVKGVAFEAGIEPIPSNAPEVAARYLRASPDARTTWTPL